MLLCFKRNSSLLSICMETARAGLPFSVQTNTQKKRKNNKKKSGCLISVLFPLFVKYVRALCILQDWLWTVAKGLRALQVKDNRGEEGLWRGCTTKLTHSLICYMLSSYEIILLYVSKFSLLSYTMDERIKGLKKLYSVLGNLTNSVCTSVPAAPFILFFGWLGGWRDLSFFNPFLHTIIFPLL